MLNVEHHLHEDARRKARRQSLQSAEPAPTPVAQGTQPAGNETELFWWLPPEEGKVASVGEKNAAELAEKHGMPEVEVIYYLDKEIAAQESCQSLPFTLLLVISYTAMVISHAQSPYVASVEDSLVWDIASNANFAFTSPFIGHKGYEDVNSHTDFWSWINRGLIPLLWRQQFAVSEAAEVQRSATELDQVIFDLPIASRGVWLLYNRIVVGVRMSQERADETVSCEHHSGLEAFYNRACSGGTGYELEPELFNARRTTAPTSLEWFYVHDDLDTIESHMYGLERDGWLDQYTKKVEIAIPVYNAEYGLHTMIYCNFFFSRGGRIWKAIIPMSAFENWFPSIWNFIFDSTWVLCIIYIIGSETLEILGVLKRYGIPGLWEEYIGFWNAMDWFSAMTGIGLAAGFMGNIANVNGMNDLIEELGNISPERETDLYRLKGQQYIEALELEVQYMYWFRLSLASYPFIIVLRLFKAFAAQPRLSVVTRTLTTSSVDLSHFLIIYMSVFMMYAVAAVVLFGRDIPDFTTVGRSVTTCFRMMLGDFDWDTLKLVGRVDAAFFFVPFSLLLTIILLNMLIAMVMDAYSMVVEQIGSTPTLWAEGRTAYKRWRTLSRGEAASLSAIVATLRRDMQDKKKGAVDDRELNVDDERSMAASKSTNRVRGNSEEAKAAAKAAKPKSKKLMVTVSSLRKIIERELGEKKSSFCAGQARQILAESLLLYSKEKKEKPDVEDVVSSFRKISWRSAKLQSINENALKSQSLARNRTSDVMECIEECVAEIEAAREDLADWLIIKDEDEPLSERMLRELEKAKNMKVCECGNVFVDEAVFCRKCGRRRQKEEGQGRSIEGPESRRQDSRSMASGGRKIDLAEGTWCQVLSDEAVVINACREAGLDVSSNLLRRTAVGKMVKVIERDDRQGIARCHVPNYGELWFAFGALGIKVKDEPVESTTVSDRSGLTDVERVHELEQELLVGRETVAEALQAVTELHSRLQRTRAEKRSGMDKFGQLRQKAMLLSKENRAQREMFQQGQVNLRVLTGQRDEHFERVRNLMQENQELKEALDQAKSRKTLGRSYA